MGEQIFNITSGNTKHREEYNTLYKCINHTGLFAFAIMHTTMAQVYLLSHSHNFYCSNLFITHLEVALVAYILMQLPDYLHT